jgi:polyphosphate kinase 2
MSNPDYRSTFSHTLEIKLELKDEELEDLDEQQELLALLASKDIDVPATIANLHYERELERLQIELVCLQEAVRAAGRRVALIFEGRDAAGKSGAIARFIENLNPRSARVVALPKPSELEQGQWYFQRYARRLPNRGELVLFDRSWYNRAVVEPVMGYCTEAQYIRFMEQAPEFERMLVDDGIELVKLWFKISRKEQQKRFKVRAKDPLKQWKLSPVDEEAQQRWDVYTRYIAAMFAKSHSAAIPWTIVNSNNKAKARLESIRHVLTVLEYTEKNRTGCVRKPDAEVVEAYDPATHDGD